MSKMTKEGFLRMVRWYSDTKWVQLDITGCREFDPHLADLHDTHWKAFLNIVDYCRSRLEQK